MVMRGATEKPGLRRRLDMRFGASVQAGGDVRFSLWAPAAHTVEVGVRRGESVRYMPLEGSAGGFFTLTTAALGPGDQYGYRIDGRPFDVPDPASRYQPCDVHGPSEVIDPAAFLWEDAVWRGRPWEDAVLYELHVGSFTAEGTFAAAQGRLAFLAELGVTAVELMPVADFPGRWNWGYDGVLPFAPDGRYGRPEDLKGFVQAAHALGLMVILDVVYNHFGPEGNYLGLYAPQFFTSRHKTPWGDGINFDGADSAVVREFVVSNALYWLEEYHIDGLRLDAVHAISDDSPCHILAEIATAVRARTAGRHCHLILENDRNEARYLRRGARGHVEAYTAQWNDDVHHALHVLLTGEEGGYYADYRNEPAQGLVRGLTEGFIYQGQPSSYRSGARRGESSADLPPGAFVCFLQNHDQIGNRALGERIGVLADERAVEAATVLLLLAPSPPLLFMGEEWGCQQPFPFFCDFSADIADAVRSGRRREFAAFAQFQGGAQTPLPDPLAEETFLSARLLWESSQSRAGKAWLDLHRTLLALRAQRVVPRLRRAPIVARSGQMVAARVVQAAWTFADGETLCVLANLAGAEIPIGVSGADVLFRWPPHWVSRDTLGPWAVVWQVVHAGETA
ncbi:MAG: malto-oligosyltrehalose trehalohydrolase [Gammaproteobacteria bacterium]|nr:malto-oligosyltrehalose trehalohydrolase [Gammaproteobacteria bacterium]